MLLSRVRKRVSRKYAPRKERISEESPLVEKFMKADKDPELEKCNNRPSGKGRSQRGKIPKRG